MYLKISDHIDITGLEKVKDVGRSQWRIQPYASEHRLEEIINRIASLTFFKLPAVVDGSPNAQESRSLDKATKCITGQVPNHFCAHGS
jgi:hypothetical protein